MKIQKLLFVAVLCGSFLLSLASQAFAEGKYVIYVQDGCVHCANVEEFVNKFKLNDIIEYRNIRRSSQADAEMAALFAKYNKTDQAGTPAMEVDGQLYAGDTPIYDFFRAKFNITEEFVPTGNNNQGTPTDKVELSSTDTAFLILGGVIILALTGYGIYSAVRKD